jgi:hypothetical protein
MAYDSFSGGNSLRLSSTPQGFANPAYESMSPSVGMSDNVSLRGQVSTVPKGTIMMVKLDQPLNSASSKVGDAVSAQVEADVYLDNQIAVPAGTIVEGMISSVVQAGHVSKPGALEVQFSALKMPNGYTYPLRAHVITDDNTGVLRGDSSQSQVLKTAGSAVGVTAAGTLAGTAAGGLLGAVGSGALFGLAAGGLAGVTYAVIREGKEVSVPSGARLSIVLDQPLGMN